MVAKPEWGLKRVCQSCSARFYDLARSPIMCPKCGTEFDPEAQLKNKRAKSTPAAARPVAKPVPVEVEEAEPAEDEAAVADDAEGDDKEEEDVVIEDTTELGGDDDVTEVIENVDKEEER